MGYYLGLIVVLAGLWLGLSGHYDPLILTLGGISIAISVLLAARLETVDREGAPYLSPIRYLRYWFWLIIEIYKANVDVIKACLKPELDIEPALVVVKTRCETDLAKTIFANSITLTPGTVTVGIEGNKLMVHALYEASAGPGAFDEMDRRSLIAADGRKALKPVGKARAAKKAEPAKKVNP